MTFHLCNRLLQVGLNLLVLGSRDHPRPDFLDVRPMLLDLVLDKRAVELSAGLALEVRRKRGRAGARTAGRRGETEVQLLSQRPELFQVLGMVGGQLPSD